MIRIGVGITEPMAVDIGFGGTLTCRPLEPGVLALAEARARRRLARETEDEDDGDDRDENEDRAAARDARFKILYVEELGALIVAGWEGVGNEEGSAPASCTPAAVRALLRQWPFCETFEARVRATQIALLSAKKGFGPSPSGTSAVAPNTANGAGRTKPDAPADLPEPADTSAPTTATPPAGRRRPRSGAPS